MKTEVIQFKSLLDSQKGKGFLIYCPGKNITEWQDRVMDFVGNEKLLTIGSNNVMNLISPDYHIFTNNTKYEHYGADVKPTSQLMLGAGIENKWINKHNPPRYVHINFKDKKGSPMRYRRKVDRIDGFYRTSGNLAIMVAHLMGAKVIYIAGMCGFTYKFDGDVHYYKAEASTDRKSKSKWWNEYDKPVSQGLKQLRACGVNFKIITPTIYKEHYVEGVI